MKKVGKIDAITGRYLSYNRADKHHDGWVDANLYSPPEFMLVEGKIKGKKEAVKVWSTGKNWDGIRIREGDIVEYWRIDKSPTINRGSYG